MGAAEGAGAGTVRRKNDATAAVIRALYWRAILRLEWTLPTRGGPRVSRQTEAILDLIYQATLEPERWPDILAAICASTGFASGCLIMDSAAPGSAAGTSFYATRRTERALRDFVEAGLFASCAGRLDRVGDALFVHEADFPAAVARRPAVETLHRLGLWDQTATLHRTPDGRRFVFTFEREAGAAGFSREAVGRLNRLRPHMVRSVTLGLRDPTAEARPQGPSLLGALPGPAVLIGPDEGVFEANAAALAHHPPLVRETGGESGRLSLAGWENAEFIRARIGLAARFGRGVDLTLRPRDPALPEQRLQAVPTSWHGAAALLVTLDPAGDDPPSRDPHALMDGFGLTRREAELTALLACGSSLTDAAPALGMSRETARHHLKQIFQKTDTHRQAQLVALVSREA